MTPPPSFKDLLERVRGGDDRAAEELVRHYEPVIRVTVRARLSDSRLRRVFDSMDVCQSVLGSFFARAALGQFDLQKPEDLIGLLVRMTQNKVALHTRQQRRQRRDYRRTAPEGAQTLDHLPGDPDPGEVVANRELLAALRASLSEEERDMVDRRGRGESWQDIAEALGGTAMARRQQFTRALKRVGAQMGLDEKDNDL